MSNEKTKNITIQQIDKLATILESNSFTIKKEAQGKVAIKGLAKIFEKSYASAFSKALAGATGGVADEAAKTAAKAAAADAAKAALRQNIAREFPNLTQSQIDDLFKNTVRKVVTRGKITNIVPRNIPPAPAAPAIPTAPTAPGNIPQELQKYLKYNDATKKYVAIDVPTTAGGRRAIQKQIAEFIANENKAVAAAAAKAAKAAKDLEKFQAGIDAAVKGMGFTAKARKGAIALGSLSVLYFMLTGKPASSEDPNSQKVIKKVMENAGSLADSSIKLPNLTNKISSFTSSLNSLDVSEEKKTRLSGYIDKLSSIQKALEKCGEPLSDKNANTFIENLKTAENEINSYLGKHDNLIAFLTKNSDLGPAAEGIKQDLINYLGAVEATRKNMGKA